MTYLKIFTVAFLAAEIAGVPVCGGYHYFGMEVDQ